MGKKNENWWEIALRIISRREHTEFELSQKLKMRGATQGEVAIILKKMKDYKYIDDKRAAEMHIKSLIRKNNSKKKIYYTLHQIGIAESITDEIMERLYTDDTEFKAALEGAKKKLRRISTDLPHKKKKEKIFRYLAGKGFASDIIFEITDQLLTDSDYVT